MENGSTNGHENENGEASGDEDGDGEDPKGEGPASKVLIWPEGVSKAAVSTAAASVFLVRDLITTPCEDMGPQHLEVRPESFARRGQAMGHVRLWGAVAPHVDGWYRASS